MAEFYGQVKGQSATSATRCGTKNSGIKVAAQSWNGSVIVEMREGRDGATNVRISVNGGSSPYGREDVYCGTLDALLVASGIKHDN